MGVEEVFRVVLITEFSLFSIIRIEYHRSARKAGYKTLIEESRPYSIALGLFIIYEVVTFFIYIFYPQLLMWAAFSMLVSLRWLGASIGALSLLLFVWTHRSLEKNFSVKLSIKEQQGLVTDGPYHWTRHPMYVAFYLLNTAAFLLTSNWFIGATWLAGLTIIIALRVRREEAMMIERFGEQYISYMKRTGRLIPLIRLNPFHNSG